MKTIVIYKSKTGFAKNYAQWIAKSLSADIFDASKVTAEKLISYDTIIYVGGLYIVGINGIKLIKENLNKLKGKKLVVIATGASPSRTDTIEAVKNGNFTAEELEHIKVFYLRGGFNYEKLFLIDKILMNLLKLKLKSKKDKAPDEKGMLSAYANPMDFTREENIREVIEYVNG